MYGLDMINTSVLGALGCDMNTFLRYFPAAETMYSLLVALAIGLILLGWVWNLFKNYGLGLGVDAEDPVKLTAKAILFIVLAYFHAFSLLYIRAKEAFAKTSATISSSAGAAETTESSFAEHSACA